MTVSKTVRRGSSPWRYASKCECGEMVYSGDLKSPVERHAGSSPASRTNYRRNCMSKREDTLKKAYGNMPREVGFNADWELPTWRGIKYYWYKLIRSIKR